jgi:hypothetical protein
MPKELSSSYPRRRDFERGANLLKESIDNQRIVFSSGDSHFEDSLKRIRILPNGRLNLDTIDELVRSCFHMLVAKHLRNHETEE